MGKYTFVMERITTVASKITSSVRKASTSIQIKITTLAVGRIIKRMGMGSSGIFKESYTLEIGFMMSKMASEKNIGLMEQYFEEFLKEAIRKKASLLGPTTATTKEIS